MLTFRTLVEADLDGMLFAPGSRDQGAEWLARQGREEVTILVAERAGVAVARLGIDFVKQASEGTAYLWSAHVDPAYQSSGIGTALFRQAEELAKVRAVFTLQLAVEKINFRALALYQRLGYTISGETVDHWTYCDGARVVTLADPCWVLHKHLAQ